MTRPRRLVVGWATWDIQWLTDEEWLSHDLLNPNNGGETHPTTHTIYVRLQHPGQGMCDSTSLKEVLVHEVLHAIFHSANLGYGIVQETKRHRLEEAIVGGMAGPLLATMRDNPTFAKWICEK